MQSIVQMGEPVLREHAGDIPVADIPSKKIQTIIAHMHDVLDAEQDGAALAAPQIGVSLRLFVISKRVFGDGSDHPSAGKDPHFVFINPKIIRRSKKRVTLDEGCLSVRGRYGTIVRHTNVTIRAYDEHGKPFTRGAGGLLAQAFQHECDHLDGVLFVDHARETWDVSDDESRRRRLKD